MTIVSIAFSMVVLAAAPSGAVKPAAGDAEAEATKVESSGAIVARARQLAAAGDAAGAMDLLKSALEARPDAHDLRLALGDVYLSQKKYQHALNAYSKVLLKDPRVPRAASGRALALVGLGDVPKAVTWAKKATEMAPDDIAAWDVLGQVYLTEQYLDAPRAEATYRQMLVLDPGNRRARMQLARALSYQKKIEAAIEQLEALTADNPEDWPVQIKLAESYYATRKMTRAREILQRVLAARPDDPEALRLMDAVEGRQAYNFWVPVAALIALPILFLLFGRLRRGKKIEA